MARPLLRSAPSPASFPRRLCALPPAAVALLAACGDGEPTLFSAPAEIRTDGLLEFAGSVGNPVGPLPTLRVVDARGNPVPGVTLEFRIEEGGGRVNPPSASTDEVGQVRPSVWFLGQEVGRNAFVAELPGRDLVRVEAWAEAGPPDHFEAQSPTFQEADTGAPVTDLPTVRLQDRFRNPVAGHDVRFVPDEGSGEVEGDLVTTDEEGLATLGGWTLSTRAGEQVVRTRVEGMDGHPAPQRFVVMARPGPAVAFAAASPTTQDAEMSRDVPDPPAVIFLDEHENGVPGVEASFTVVEGGGSVVGSPVVSGQDGIARLERWIAGSELGPNRVVASADGFSDVEFRAEGVPFALALTVEAVHLNQASQRLGGDIGGLAGRPGVLRVVIRANQENSEAPAVRVRLFQGGSLVRQELLPANREGVVTEPNLAFLSYTWNLPLAPEEVVPGLSVSVEVDPDSVALVGSRDGHVFPQGGSTVSLDVRPMAPLRLVFIPVTATLHGGQTGDIDSGNVNNFLANTLRWLPVGEVQYEIQGSFVTDQDLTTQAGWTNLLNALQAKRTAEEATDQYYHGIVPSVNNLRWAGFAFVPSTPDSPFRTGISWDNLPAASRTLAHELGHNLGRWHSPCGTNIAGVDPNYPHEGAYLGVPGYNVFSGQLVVPWLTYDFMGYCQPSWVSDYTWEGTVEWRRNDPLASGDPGAGQAVAAGSGGSWSPPAPPAAEPGLLVWGRIHAGGAELSPAFHLEAPPSLPGRGGPHRLRGVAADGRELFRLSFEGERVDHSEDPDERLFSFFVPLADADADLLVRIELDSPRGRAVREVASVRLPDVPAPELRDPEVVLDRLAGDRVRLGWDAERFPMAMLRDPATGRVKGFVRAGETIFPDLRIEGLEVLLSDGVRSRPAGLR